MKVILKGGPGSGHRGHAGRPGSVGGSSAGNIAGGTLATGKNELYRWANLTEAVDISWRSREHYSLDVSDKQDFYFAPTSISPRGGGKTSYTYGRFILDSSVLEAGGWSKDPQLKAEGAWRWKPGNLGKSWRDFDEGFKNKIYAKAIRGYEVVSLPDGLTMNDVQSILNYRFERHIPVLRTTVKDVTAK